MEPCLLELMEAGVQFVGFVADNEAVNTALWKLLKIRFPFLIRVPCAAHTIQLVVKSSMECRRWVQVRAGVDEILKHFSSSKEARQRLINLQQGGQVYNLVKPNDTRWNSFLFASQRLIKLRRFIDIVLEQTSEFWSELAALIAFLEPFQIATDVVQKDAATLFDVFAQWNRLSAHVQAQADASVKAKAMKALSTRWESQVNGDATIAAAILSLDVNLEAIAEDRIEAARRFIVDFGVKYLLGFGLSALSEEEKRKAADPSRTIQRQARSFLNARGTSSCNEEGRWRCMEGSRCVVAVQHGVGHRGSCAVADSGE
jgi:hypothetical protein